MRSSESKREIWLRVARAAALAFLSGLLGFACQQPAYEPRKWNVLMVLVDTLRADRLSLYGYERKTSPTLDRFAQERGVVFRSAWANAGCTYPSVASLLTSRWPQLILANPQQRGLGIPGDLPTLAERLVAQGYSAEAVSSSTVVRATPSKRNYFGGYGRGFAGFDESCEERSAACVNRVATRTLERLAEPFFLYLHYLDPHCPYRPPQEARRYFDSPETDQARGWAKRGAIAPLVRKLYERKHSVEFDERDIRALSDLYDEEVRYFDDQFAELIAALERRKLLDRTLVVFLSDHGEELYDHGHISHCRNLAYENILGTPLVLAVPGLAPGERWATVSNLDVVPTLLDLLGIPVGPGSVDGTSLRPLLEKGDRASEPRLTFAAQGSSRAVRDERQMLRLDLRDSSTELTALPTRGGKKVDSVEESTAVRRLRSALVDWIRAREKGGSQESVRQADELERELTAVGYL